MAFITQETKKAIKAALDDLNLGNSWKLSLSISHNSALNVAIMRAPKTVLDDYVPTEYQLERNPDLVVDETTSLYVNERNVSVSWKGETLRTLERIIETIKTAGKWFDKSDSMTDYFNIAFYISVSFGNGRTDRDCEFVGRRRRVTKSAAVAEVAAERGIPVIDIIPFEDSVADAVVIGGTDVTAAVAAAGLPAGQVQFAVSDSDNVVPLFARENREPTLAEKIEIARAEMIRRYKEAFRATPVGATLNDYALSVLAEAALKTTVD